MTPLFPRSGMREHLGIRITSAEKDKLVGEIDVDHRHLNKGGIVHGGALLAFADNLGGTVAGLNIPEGFKEVRRMTEAKLAPNLPGWMVDHANRYLSNGGTDGHMYKSESVRSFLTMSNALLAGIAIIEPPTEISSPPAVELFQYVLPPDKARLSDEGTG
jgi:hypothetical protein